MSKSMLTLSDQILMGKWHLFYLTWVGKVSNYAPLLQRTKYPDWIIQGFPINRYIKEAIQLFGEIKYSDSFFSLPSDERYNLTHEPTTTIDILPASLLHSYTFIFRWLNLIAHHLNCGKLTWSPKSHQ